jgi:uncharacterized protein (UPF0332 family)
MTTFKWAHYLLQAKALQVDPESPDLGGLRQASFRSATSRAYYAAYNCALDFAKHEGFQPTEDSHGEVWGYFKTGASNGDRVWIGRNLKKLYQHRKDVDYREAFSENPLYKAKLAVNLAEKIIKKLDVLPHQ